MAEENYYSSPQQVIGFTGVRKEDFGLDTENDLEELVESWLVQVKDFIDADRNRDYHQEVEDEKRLSIPPGIHSIALRIVANMVGQAQMRRETPIVQHDDFSIQMLDDKIFSSAIQKDLARYPYKPNVSFVRTGKKVEEDD